MQMMNTNRSDNHGSPPEDSVATQADAQLRDLFSSLPASKSTVDFNQRVLLKLHRRKITIRATCAASLIVLLTVGWQLSSDGTNPQQPTRVANNKTSGDVVEPGGETIVEFELFATAYRGLASPVVQLDTHANESQALLNCLGSLEETLEKK
jgi:hypothetical protein